MSSEQVPLRMCFSNHDLGRQKCQLCPDARRCQDTQAGYGISNMLDSLALNIETEERGLPDWVMEIDERIISEEDWETLKAGNPQLFRAYKRFNDIPEG